MPWQSSYDPLPSHSFPTGLYPPPPPPPIGDYAGSRLHEGRSSLEPPPPPPPPPRSVEP
eukprot:CAMPEP_0118902014 /NCGR_PEP_ID=MMETSP1166-20130328/7487_1 /TAXON_ID=1104430 /ORGANISM="Chrysoreinhardia sp, Strain CCMP3193" /LENGTH=58 /DNA_ID=CAMNT_0006841209 /DNA_START=109 /DNA_END=282 /DNA_ORIENTATION=-